MTQTRDVKVVECCVIREKAGYGVPRGNKQPFFVVGTELDGGNPVRREIIQLGLFRGHLRETTQNRNKNKLLTFVCLFVYYSTPPP